jgi:hypothetical protein
MPDIRREGGDHSVPLPDQFGIDERTIFQIHIPQQTAVPVGFGDIFHQNHLLTLHQRPVGLGGFTEEIVAPLRGVHADVADTIRRPADGNINCITVNNIGNGRQVAVRYGR